MNQIETDHRLRMANVGARLTMAMATFGISVEDAGQRTGYPALKVLSIVTGQPDVTLLEYSSFAAALGCRINVDVVAIETTSAPVQQSAPVKQMSSASPAPKLAEVPEATSAESPEALPGTSPEALPANRHDMPAITPDRLASFASSTRGDKILATV